MVIGHTLQALVYHNHRNIKHKAEAFSEFLDARQVSIVKTFSFHNMYILNNIHIVIAESLDNAHLVSKNQPPESPRLLLIKFDCFQCYRHSSQSNTCQIITGKDTKHVSKLEIKQLTLNYHLE